TCQPAKSCPRASAVHVHRRRQEAIMKNERGSAMIVVLTLTILIAILVVANSFELSRLRRELKRIDLEQQKKFAPAAVNN
ncbi:MAG TPA: hypothetical protein VMR25_20860, partial [Planctomycetaceae bacterium]|nr:hypothetical protein [Planctomycetaceae bacterium]